MIQWLSGDVVKSAERAFAEQVEKRRKRRQKEKKEKHEKKSTPFDPFFLYFSSISVERHIDTLAALLYVLEHSRSSNVPPSLVHVLEYLYLNRTRCQETVAMIQ